MSKTNISNIPPARASAVELFYRFLGPLVFSLFTLLLLSACSSEPSASRAKSAVQEQIKTESQDRIRLVLFRKQNASNAELLGAKIYLLEFAAEIRFTESCKWSRGVFGAATFQTSQATEKAGSGMAAFMENTMNPGLLVKAGQRARVSGVVRFLKKERGWVVDDISLSDAILQD